MPALSPETLARHAESIVAVLAKLNGPQRKEALSSAAGLNEVAFRKAIDQLVADGLVKKYRPEKRDHASGDGKRGPLAFVYELTETGRAQFEFVEKIQAAYEQDAAEVKALQEQQRAQRLAAQ